MQRLQIHIDDRRRARPKVLTVKVPSEAEARRLAEQLFAKSEDHLGVEVCEEGRRLFGLGTLANRTVCGQRPAAVPA